MIYIGKIPDNLKYTKEHEWINLDDNPALVGITDYAQHALTDIVFVELPDVGKTTEQLKPLCVIESVKSVSDVFAPMSGEVVEVNNNLSDKPEYVNQDAYGKGWILKIKVSKEIESDNLMDSQEYKKYIEGLQKK